MRIYSYIPPTPLQLLSLQSLGKGSKSQLLSFTDWGSARMGFSATTLLRELLLGCSNLWVLSLHYKSLGHPCDLRKVRLDTGLFTSPIQWNFSGKRAVTPIRSPVRLKMSKSRELGHLEYFDFSPVDSPPGSQPSSVKCSHLFF